MKLKRICFVVLIIIIFIGCYSHMNANFDSLSRYPYENENDRYLIKKYLNTDEIEYIIEYSIAPVEFIRYIENPSFNIFHTNIYHYIGDVFWYLDDNTIVDISEKLIILDKVEEAVNLSTEYYYNEILYYLENGDEYNNEAKLVENPNSITVYLDEYYTISIRNPYPLSLVDFMNTNENEIFLRSEVIEPLKNMMEGMKNDLSSRYTDNLYIENGYISYDAQKELYESGEVSDYPGHSEHQLGLAFDFNLYNGNYSTSAQYKWLTGNAYKYGFIIDEDSTSQYERCKSNHLRFIGYDLALLAHDNNLSLKEVLNK